MISRTRFSAKACGALLLLALASTSLAGSAQWSSAPGSSDWNTATNWMPNTVPSGFGDEATFDTSSVTSVLLSTYTNVGAISFTPNATTSYTITVNPSGSGFYTPLFFREAGVANNSGVTQNFIADVDSSGNNGQILFTVNATAGSLTSFTNNGAVASGALGGFTALTENSTADHGTFINNGGTVSGAEGGDTRFDTVATAANGSFINNAAAVMGAYSGLTDFFDLSTAANSTITNNGATVSGASGGTTIFDDGSSADAATLISNGGTGGGGGGRIYFFTDSIGGTSRVQVFGNGKLDISLRNAPGVTIGSIEGSGNVFLGANVLTVGSANSNTNFSGSIQDGGFGGGSGGSLSKIGTGTLIVDGVISTAVTVNGGTLGGSGQLGAVTVHSGGTLSPGDGPNTAILSVTGALALTSGSTYAVYLNGAAAGTDYDQTNVTGTINLKKAVLAMSLNFTPAPGTTFTIINNDGRDKVKGTFVGLGRKAKFMLNGLPFKISYKGGDGNDVVLTAL